MVVSNWGQDDHKRRLSRDARNAGAGTDPRRGGYTDPVRFPAHSIKALYTVDTIITMGLWTSLSSLASL